MSTATTTTCSGGTTLTSRHRPIVSRLLSMAGGLVVVVVVLLVVLVVLTTAAVVVVVLTAVASTRLVIEEAAVAEGAVVADDVGVVAAARRAALLDGHVDAQVAAVGEVVRYGGVKDQTVAVADGGLDAVANGPRLRLPQQPSLVGVQLQAVGELVGGLLPANQHHRREELLVAGVLLRLLQHQHKVVVEAGLDHHLQIKRFVKF